MRVLLSLCGSRLVVNDLHCHLEELSSSLNTCEFHSFGKYFEDFSQHEKMLNPYPNKALFEYMLVRIDADVDLWLYDSSNTAVGYSSLAVGT